MIRIEGLTLYSEQLLLKSLDIEWQKNQFWAILGKNGVGKSTLLHHVAGLSTIKEGEIWLNNQSLKCVSNIKRAQTLSILTQKTEPNLDGTVEQMVQLGRYPWRTQLKLDNSDQEIIDKVIEFAGIQNIIDKNVHQLSGGELRRVELANSLVQDTAVILLDEPLNHLDLNFKFKLLRYLKKQQQEKLTVMVTHDLHFVQKYCSHVLFIGTNGKWIAGPLEDIFTINNLRKYLELKLEDIDFLK